VIKICLRAIVESRGVFFTDSQLTLFDLLVVTIFIFALKKKINIKTEKLLDKTASEMAEFDELY
jgi:hypothetical protein